MKNLSDFLRNFFNNKGHHIFLSLLVTKVCGFIGSALIFRLLDKSEFGSVSMVMSLSAVFLAFSGFGSQQGLLRFGSIASDSEERNALSSYLFRKGFVYHIVLSFIFLASSVFYIEKYEHILYLFIFFSIRLIGFYFYNYIQSELRINDNNQEFARLNNIVNISGLAPLLTLTYFFQLTGYLVALTITPFISLFWFRQIKFKNFARFSFSKKEIWSYNLQTAGTALLSDTLFALDILLLGFILNESAVANYKAAILLPSNITFLALTFMQSDFPELAKNHRNKAYLKNYIFNYYKIFIPLCVVIFAVSFALKDELVTLVSGNKYQNLGWPFSILLLAFLLNMLFRNLYGNLLSAVGMMKVNTAVSASVLVILSGLAYFIVPKYGLNGMALTMAISLLFTGIVLMISFFSYLKKL